MLEYTLMQMRAIILNLSEWMNTPNDELEDMMGISWMQFWDLVNQIKAGEEE